MKLSNHLTSLRTACAVVALVFGLGVGGAWAQAPGGDPDPKAATLSEILKLAQADDLAGARELAFKTAKQFEASGDRFYAARYSLSAMLMASYQTDWKFIVDTYGGRLDALLADLDAKEPIQGDRLIHVMAFAKAGVGDAAERDRLGKVYVDRIVARNGPTSEPALNAPIDVAVVQIKTGDPQKGYEAALPALEALAATDRHQLTLARFNEVAMALNMGNRGDLASAVFQKGVSTAAAQQFLPENGELYANYARLLSHSSDRSAQMRMYELFEGAINISRHGGDQKKTLALLNEYAMTLNNTGASGKALSTIEDTIWNAEELYGKTDDRTLDIYANYSEILRNFGAPANAVDADMAVYTNRLARYGEKDEKVLAAANGLGQEYLTLSKFDDARKYFEISRKLAAHSKHRENIEKNSDAWLLLTDVLSRKAAPDAETQKRLAAIADDASFAPILRIRAGMSSAAGLTSRGDGKTASELLKRMRDVSIQVFTADHPLSFEIERLMVLAVADSDPKYAASYYAELNEAMFGWLNTQTRMSNDVNISELLRGHADMVLDDFGKFAERHEEGRAYFALTASRWKGLLSGGLTGYRRIEYRQNADDEQLRSLVRNALRLNAQLTAVMSSDRNNETTGQLIAKQAQAANALTARMAELGITVPNDGSSFDFSKDLGEGEVLVNYFITRRWGPDRLAKDAVADETLYAIVTKPGKANTIVNLGNPNRTKEIGKETQIASLRGTRGALPLLNVKQPFVELYEQLIKPLEAELKDARTVYLVPDGDLFSVPFSMVQDDQGRYLEDRFTLRLLTAPDAIVGANSKPTLDPKGETLLVGNVDYRRENERGAAPLPATAREIEAIAQIQSKRGATVKTLAGSQATEAELSKQIETAKVAHLATHGVFRSEKQPGAASVDTLWQSEVVLAGSGDRMTNKRDPNDGRLYAFEVMDWDLSKLELLVLSACDTGRGDESFVSGLRGLPTALGIAGARRSLLTLWPVEDKGTANFMIRYYELLGEGETYAEALRTTRREAREGKVEAASDPRVWAAFVLFEG